MGVTTGTLTVQVDRLEARGLARRVPHERDRRSWLVELSDKGMSYFKEHDSLHERLTAEITDALTDEERAVFLGALEKMNRRF